MTLNEGKAGQQCNEETTEVDIMMVVLDKIAFQFCRCHSFTQCGLSRPQACFMYVI